MTRIPWASAAALAGMLASSNALAAERQMLLEIILNGRSTGRVGEFVERDGILYAYPPELRDLGFRLPARIAADTDLVPVKSIPELRTQVDEAKQTLIVSAPNSALLPVEIGAQTSTRLAPLTPSSFGAVLNYDILGTFTGQQNTGGALLQGRLFSPYGLLESTELANARPYAGQSAFARLDTNYTYTEPDQLRRWQAGDLVTGALNWTRAVRLGGVQVRTDFNLRPDLITYPLPVISSTTAVPSSVDVTVNGIRQYSGSVQPGPFAVRTLPVVTGAGEVAVAVQNAVGQQTLVTLPFYASAALLKPGLASYSLDVGAIRQNYGLVNDEYAGWATTGSFRYGLLDWLTLEAHGEAADALTLLGVGSAVQIGTLGVANAAVAGSSGCGNRVSCGGQSSSGAEISVGFQRQSRSFNISVAGTWTLAGYHDVAAISGVPVPSTSVSASVGYQLGTWGNVGLAYIDQRSRPLTANTLFPQNAYGTVVNPKAQLVIASYSVPVAGRFNVYATGYKDVQHSHSYGVGLGVSILLGRTVSASAGVSLDNGHGGTFLDVAKPTVTEGDYGYRVLDAEGADAHREVDGEYLARWSRLAAGVDQSAAATAGRVGANGSLALAGGNLFAGDEIYDSFAVVRTGNVANVPVTYENRLVGNTDSDGQIVVPSLRSYQNNKIGVDPSKLPPDIEVGATEHMVRPSDRAGIVVDFPMKVAHGGLLKLQDGKGTPIPLGAVVQVEGEADRPVGFDGEAYVTGLGATNRLVVVLPDGNRCRVAFPYQPVKGDIPVIGPLPCQ